MGCCESRDKDNPDQADVKSALAEEFDTTRPLERRGSATNLGSPDLEHFSHSFQLNNLRNIEDIYTIEDHDLGTGVAGAVRKVVHKSTQAIRAVKIIKPKAIKAAGMASLRNEISIMRDLDHPHIIKLYEVFHNASVLYLVMELCTGGELFDRIIAESSFSEHRAAGFMKQILGAIFYLHKRGIVHRDLKPENLILQDDSPDALVKVIDFGVATTLEKGGELTARVGTPSYVAPEVLKGHYIHLVDIWSLGVICYILISGAPPFDAGDDRTTMKNIKRAAYDFPSDPWDAISEEAKDLIKSVLTVNYLERPEASALLQHPWIQKYSNQTLKTEPLNRSIISNFEAYNRSRKMKKLSLTLIATQLQQDELEKLRHQFEALDINGDGMLSREELTQGMESLEIEAADVEALMSIDSDGSGEIDWTEFIAAAMHHQQYQRKEVLMSAFNVFDINGDGKITKTELKTILETGNGVGVSDQQIQELIADADKDGDGEIDFEEFEEMMTAPQGNSPTDSLSVAAAAR